jgi:hypothetical protein
LKTNKLLIFRPAKNAQYHEIAPDWNVSGTRTFQPASEFREEDSSSPATAPSFRKLARSVNTSAFVETNLVKLLPTGLLTRSGSPERLTLCSDPEGTLSNQYEGGQTVAASLPFSKIKKKNLG